MTKRECENLLFMDTAIYKLISSYLNIIRNMDAFKFCPVDFLEDFAQESCMSLLRNSW